MAASSPSRFSFNIKYVQHRNRTLTSLSTSLVFWAVLATPFAAPATLFSQAPGASHAQRAHQLLSEKKPDLAIPEFRAVLAADPNNLDAQANLGVLLFFRGDYSGAEPYLHQAVNQQPDLPKIRALLGLSEKYLGRSFQARADLELAVPQLAEPPIRIQAGLALVELDVASQDLDKASSVLGLLRQVAPTDPRVLYAAYRISTDQAGEALVSLSLAAPDSPQMHQAMAHELERNRDLPATVANLKKAAELDPDLPGIHYEYAEALAESDDPKLRAAAEGEYKLALEHNPHDARSAAALGDIATARGDLAAAASFYQQALALDPHLAEAQIGLAHSDTERGDFAAAVPILEQVTAADPTNTLAHFRLSAAYRKLGRTADAKRELDAYQHLKQIKDRMRVVYKEMRQQSPDRSKDSADASPK